MGLAKLFFYIESFGESRSRLFAIPDGQVQQPGAPRPQRVRAAGAQVRAHAAADHRRGA